MNRSLELKTNLKILKITYNNDYLNNCKHSKLIQEKDKIELTQIKILIRQCCSKHFQK